MWRRWMCFFQFLLPLPVVISLRMLSLPPDM